MSEWSFPGNWASGLFWFVIAASVIMVKNFSLPGPCLTSLFFVVVGFVKRSKEVEWGCGGNTKDEGLWRCPGNWAFQRKKRLLC